MRAGSKKSRVKGGHSETEIDRWLRGTDLSRLSPRLRFRRVAFPHLKPTNWEKLYAEFQKSKPISIRLPVRVIDKLKQVSLQKGIGYQALIRLWVTEKLQVVS